jgi:hypothetical protein
MNMLMLHEAGVGISSRRHEVGIGVAAVADVHLGAFADPLAPSRLRAR